MRNCNLPAALLAFDSKELKELLDEVVSNYDLTFSYFNNLHEITLTDRRDKLMIIGYRSSRIEALSYVLEVWQNVQTVEVAARLFASWRDGDEQEQKETFEALKKRRLSNG